MKGLNPETVPCRKKAPCPFIPNSKREHPSEAFQTLISPLTKGGQKYFGVGSPLKVKSEFTQLLSQLQIVINFSVKRDPISSVRIGHRLTSGFSQVNNRQSAVTKRNTLTV